MKKHIWTILASLVLALALACGAASEGALGDDLYRFEALIDGVHYSFPCPFDELTRNGWTLKGEDEKLKSNQYGLVYFEKAGYENLMGYAYNCYSSARTVSQCYIGGFQLEDGYKAPAAPGELPGGIVLGASSMDDVLSAYGEPSRRYDGSSYTSLTYEYDGWQNVEITVGLESGLVQKIKMQNLTEPEGFQDEVGDTETAPPVVGLYQAPGKLGDNLLAHTVEIDKALYQIPAPVSTFLENGFTIVSGKSDEVADGSGSGWVTLMKNNQQLRILATNYDENATSIVNCFVTGVELGELEAKLPCRLPLGVELGMTQAALEEALKDVEYLTEESSSFIHYMIADNERATNAIDVRVSKESGLVNGIAVENSVRRNSIEAWLNGAAALTDLPQPAKGGVEPVSPAVGVDALSGELFSFEALIGERLYRFPMDLETLVNDGWAVDAPAAEVAPNSYDMITLKLGSAMSPKTSMTVYVFNLSKESAQTDALPVGGFRISSLDDAREPKTQFALPKGISLNSSTFDEVLSAYGEAGYQNERRSLEYELERYQSVKLSFEDDVLTGIDMRVFKD